MELRILYEFLKSKDNSVAKNLLSFYKIRLLFNRINNIGQKNNRTHKVSASVMVSDCLLPKVSPMAQPKISGVTKCALPQM